MDIPQLLSEHSENKLPSESIIKEVLTRIRNIRDYISSTHIWGYNFDEQRPHDADFDTYFKDAPRAKDCFLQEICKLFDDGKARYFVPEVGSPTAVKSIVNDLRNAGIEFVEPE